MQMFFDDVCACYDGLLRLAPGSRDSCPKVKGETLTGPFFKFSLLPVLFKFYLNPKKHQLNYSIENQFNYFGIQIHLTSPVQWGGASTIIPAPKAVLGISLCGIRANASPPLIRIECNSPVQWSSSVRRSCLNVCTSSE